MDNDWISRAAAKEAVRNNIRGGATALVRVFKAIDQLPAVDAAPPAVHGRWIKLAEAPEWDQRRCTVCGDVSCCQRNYCPNCGAKMDGGEDDV